MGGIVFLSSDNMGSAVEVGLGQRTGPSPNDPSLTIGYPRWLSLLDQLGVRATFFIEGWNALHHPDRVRELVDRGHEIGYHGWVHEDFAALSADKAERVMIDSRAAFKNIGIYPRGFRAPGGLRGPHAVPLLERFGLEYDCSVDNRHAEDMTVRNLSQHIICIPWRIEAIDYHQFVRRAPLPSPESVEREWRALLDQAAKTNGLITFIFHAMTVGTSDIALGIANSILREARDRQDLTLVTAEQVCDNFKNTARPAPLPQCPK